MSTVLDVLPDVATWRADQASTATIYAGEGRNLSNAARARRAQESAAYQRRLMEAAGLYAAVINGNRRAALDFQEAMTTSDFQLLFGDILDRQILANYQSMPTQWDMVARRGRVRDFRTVKRFTLDGGEAILSDVKQQSEYPAAALTDGSYSYSVTKKGRRIPLSWETLINDDLDAFADIPRRLGNAARRSEERFWTTLYAASTGPNATYFSTANKNLIVSALYTGLSDNPTLSVNALQQAFTVLGRQLDADGAPIYVEGAVLVVPPALQVAAENILNATEILSAAGSSGTASDAGRTDQLRVTNWMRNRLRLVVNPWLPIIDTTSGSTAWYLFADPGAGRPSMEVGFLIGHETPELFQRTPNAVRVGGGPVDPTDGDFETDSVEWKIRHVYGGTLMDPKSGVASKGTAAP